MTKLQEICNEIAFDEMEAGDELEVITSLLNYSSFGDVVKINKKRTRMMDSHKAPAIFYITKRGCFETHCSPKKDNKFAQYYKILTKK